MVSKISKSKPGHPGHYEGIFVKTEGKEVFYLFSTILLHHRSTGDCSFQKTHPYSL